MSKFNPGQHLIVARDKTTGCHVHVDISEIAAHSQPPAARNTFTCNGNVFLVTNSDRMALAVGLANAAIIGGIQAGDLRWHGGQEDFSWPLANGGDVKMDAPALIAMAREMFLASK